MQLGTASQVPSRQSSSSSVWSDSALKISLFVSSGKEECSKRIRTAFSPSQLIELENAFEKNHYLVSQERKDLANKLNLSETQVYHWADNFPW